MEMTFGEFLLQAIQLRNLTQKEAARQLNISPQALNNYILNKRTPDLHTLVHILEVFSLTAEVLFPHDQHDVNETLTAEEKELLQVFRQLKPKQRQFILHMLKELPQ